MWDRSSVTRYFPTNSQILDIKVLDFRGLWNLYHVAAAAAKSLQSCPTLYDPIDGSPPGSPVWDSPGKNTGDSCINKNCLGCFCSFLAHFFFSAADPFVLTDGSSFLSNSVPVLGKACPLHTMLFAKASLWKGFPSTHEALSAAWWVGPRALSVLASASLALNKD